MQRVNKFHYVGPFEFSVFCFDRLPVRGKAPGGIIGQVLLVVLNGVKSSADLRRFRIDEKNAIVDKHGTLQSLEI